MTIRVRWSGEHCLLPVKVTPKGGRNCFLPYAEGDEAIKLKVTAPPEDGKANAAVIALLASKFNMAKSRIAISSGAQARYKQVSITLQNDQALNELLIQIAKLLQVPDVSCFAVITA